MAGVARAARLTVLLGPAPYIGAMTESVWDYPRPPRVEPSSERVVVTHGGVVVADTTASLRVLETSHPPTYYLPADAFAPGVLRPADGASWCEWKGQAAYLDLVVGDEVVPAVAWTYPTPSPGFEALLDHVALYPARSCSHSRAASTAAGSPRA